MTELTRLDVLVIIAVVVGAIGLVVLALDGYWPNRSRFERRP